MVGSKSSGSAFRFRLGAYETGKEGCRKKRCCLGDQWSVTRSSRFVKLPGPQINARRWQEQREPLCKLLQVQVFAADPGVSC